MPRASRICASTKWPIRHLAMTGMVTAAMIDLISWGSDMRATPPSLRMSAGTRSRAMTAQAPASCAMRACSGVTTSMITPPFSIWARPALTLKVPFCEPCPLREFLLSAIVLKSYAADWKPMPPRRYEPLARNSLKFRRNSSRLRANPGERRLEPLQDLRPLGRELVVGEQAVPVQPGQHVHLLQHVQQRGHGAARQVSL